MRSIRLATVLITVLFAVANNPAANAQGLGETDRASGARGTVIAEEFLLFSEYEREVYVMGAIDGIATAYYAGRWQDGGRLVGCARNRSSFELSTMLVNYIVRNKQTLPLNAANAFAFALIEFCEG